MQQTDKQTNNQTHPTSVANQQRVGVGVCVRRDGETERQRERERERDREEYGGKEETSASAMRYMLIGK
jgi:hypothetical protein